MKPLKQSLPLFKMLATQAGGFRKAQRTLALAFSLSLLAAMPLPQANAQGFPVNNAPSTTPTQLLNVTTPVNTPVTISFTVNDVEDDARLVPLTVLRAANVNPVIGDSGLVLTRSGDNNANCTLTMTPLPGAVGEAIISVTVLDHGTPPLSAIKTFKLTVTPSTSPNNPPVAVINVSPDADLDGGDPEIILISVNGVYAPVTLDGTTSYDPDPGDAVTSYAWFADSGSGPVSIGEGAALATRLGIGEQVLFLSVSDGSLASPFTVESVKVIPVSEAIGYLIAQVQASSIRAQDKRLLVGLLEASSGLFAGRPISTRLTPCEAGVQGLRVFKTAVRLLSDPRIEHVTGVTDALVAEWSYLTDQIINNVTCP